MILTKRTIETRIKKEYPHGLNLIYIDYRDHLEDKKLLEELAQTGLIQSIFEDNDWTVDSQYQTIEECTKQVFTEEEQETIEENGELREALEETFLKLDTSTPEKDLIHNTGRQYFYYDLGLEIEPGFYNDGFYSHTAEKWPENAMRKIAKKLRISYKKYEKELRELVVNADYGGQLVILFVCEPESLYGEIKNKYIKFKDDFDLCIMDRGNGSGYNMPFKKEFTFEFKRENLHSDIGDNGYSYSGDVCGLVIGDTATFKFTDKIRKSDKTITVLTNEEAEKRRKQEEVYEENWKKGQCTFGDMNIKRHINTPYRNEYPAGNKCTVCGTFWID